MMRLIMAALLLLAAAHSQTTSIFEFQSGFWVNLHHFLYEQAMGSDTVSDSPEWRHAVDYYGDLAKKDMLSREMEAINNSLSDRETATSLEGSGLEPALVEVLQEAAPEYRKRWWPEHDRANRAWIEAVQPLVQKYGPALTRELATAYGASWPADPIRTDVAEYANWAGAYTTLDPTHITVSSAAPANAGQAALEILFHEASHALVKGVTDALFREVQEQGKFLPRQDAWHALLFYTTGTIVARHLDGYTPYWIANGLSDPGWKGLLPIFERDWQPYLDRKTDRATAVRRLVEDYGTARQK